MKTKILGLLAVGLLAGPMVAHGALISYNSQAAFLAAVSNPGVDTFTGFSVTGATPGPINRNAGSYSYTATVTVNNLFFGAGTSGDPWLSVNTATDSIVFSNFGSGANAIGGLFFTSNISGLFAAGDIQIQAVDTTGSVSTTLVNATINTFLGFVSDATLVSLTVTSVQPLTGFLWPTVEDFTLATAAMTTVPEPGTLALLGLGLLGLGVSRRKA